MFFLTLPMLCVFPNIEFSILYLFTCVGHAYAEEDVPLSGILFELITCHKRSSPSLLLLSSVKYSCAVYREGEDWGGIQGLSERMSKVKSLWKSQFSQNLGFLSCFRPEISGKFIPHRIQVHHNHPEASSEAGGSNGLSGTGRLLEADHWLWDSEKRPKMIVSVCEGQNKQFEWILICSCC